MAAGISTTVLIVACMSVSDIIAASSELDRLAVERPIGGRGGEFIRDDAEPEVKSDRPDAVRRLPQAIIIGVKKGGTRALLEFLKEHPDVRAPSQEVHFFDRHYDLGLDWYRRQMPATYEGELTVEKTPSYFVTKSVPSRLHNMSSDLRLIVVVRDPVTRAVSDYTQAVSKRPELRRPFHELAFQADGENGSTTAVDTSWGAVKIGLYARHLDRWLRHFPLQRFHFVSGERLIADPVGELATVQDFLGLPRIVDDRYFYLNPTKGFPCLRYRRRRRRRRLRHGNSLEEVLDVDAAPRCLGKTKGRTHPTIDDGVLQRLREFYRPFNVRFYQMAGIDFGWS